MPTNFNSESLFAVCGVVARCEDVGMEVAYPLRTHKGKELAEKKKV